MKFFKTFKFATGSARPDVTGTGTWKPASTGGDGRGRCRGHIAGAKDKVSAAGNPYAAPHGKPECRLGIPLVVLKFYPELHSGIPPGSEQLT
ncbi:unnamed protein product [Staurois parvus]|uniref:Uncharacterized protein n=1 Tax=Staurois parvus TaxID=386267 RepID=A0ABN9GVN9_9NEOB|nr:unnamed protein product [Staurois parvus]